MEEIEENHISKIKNKIGRPRLQLDEEQIINLAKINCTMIEIASVMKCSVDSLERNFADIIKRGQEEGKTSLRRHMWIAAEKGNITMQIWLSKQLLGMREPKTEEAKELANHIVKIIDFSSLKKERDEKKKERETHKQMKASK
ncbi:hypothetical protein LCGC14_2491670 [marine sediment metagenome]|uniref:Uncharacterized protein n=1 Tax=marine sediment metagenome TaxID=412755 RepID=A0A0F9B588_9ZZZZ